MPKICVIIPFFNEENRFSESIFIDFYDNNVDIDFCFINDGSTDRTRLLLSDLTKGKEHRILFINNSKNVGKAASISVAMNKVVLWKNHDYIGYFDADFATPLSEIQLFKKSMRRHPNSYMYLGARIKRLGSNIERKFYRFILGRIIATITSLFILKIDVYDTQCGAKFIQKELVAEIFSKPFISKWLFDIEIFLRIIKIKGVEKTKNNVIEIPLNVWKDIDGSKISLSDFIKVPYNLLKIYYTYKNGK